MGFRVSDFEGRELSRELQRIKGLLRILAVANNEVSKAETADGRQAARAVALLTLETIKSEVFILPKKPISAWVVISILSDFDYHLWDTYIRYDDAKKSIFLTENSTLVPASVLHNLKEELEELRRA